MICCKCDKVSSCTVFRKLLNMSNEFSINQCVEYNESKNVYKKIAIHDDLMHLIYDYFTGQLAEGVSEEQAREVIIDNMWTL